MNPGQVGSQDLTEPEVLHSKANIRIASFANASKQRINPMDVCKACEDCAPVYTTSTTIRVLVCVHRNFVAALRS